MQKFTCQAIDAWALAFSWTGDIQRLDLMVTQPCEHFDCNIRYAPVVQLNDEIRFGHPLGKNLGSECPTLNSADIDDQCAIAVFYVAAGALAVATIGQFGELVFQWDRAVLGLAPPRCPASMCVPVLNRKIQRTTICAGLPA